MLYQRWRKIVQDRAQELALLHAPTGRRWTFSQLDQASDPPSTEKRLVFAHGNGPEFVTTVLRAWRHGRALCPIETGQQMPAVFPPPGCVHLKLTSASTGAARLVAFTADQIAADAHQIVSSMGLRPEWPNVGILSLAHSYGFSNLVTPLLLHGIPLILGASPLPESLRQMSQLAPEVTLPAVPALWRAWSQAGAIPSNVRLAISAGAPLPLALETSVFQSTGLKIHNFYGSTECGGIAYDRSSQPRSEGSFVGTALEGVALGVGVDGCLEVRGASVGISYWPEPHASLANGCFHTQDRVEINAGAVRWLGRASDLMNVAGRKLEPEGVEAALRQHPGVVECVVFGIVSGDDAARGDQVVACVLSTATEEELRTHLLGLLPAWQLPRHWWRVEAIDANGRGKTPRAEWRRRWLESRAELSSPPQG